jgi:hypothetical protein
MKLVPLYRMSFSYLEEYGVSLSGADGTQSSWYFRLEGRIEGRINGRVFGANHPERRTDRTFVPDVHGVIETDDGAIIMVESQGYGRAYPPGARQIVCSQTHLSSDERYAWLNDTVCVGTGEVRVNGPDDVVIVIDIAELIWEPMDS